MIKRREKKTTVKQYGNALLLHSEVPSLKAFESWREVYALALVSYTPGGLKMGVYIDIRPNLYPEKLLSVGGRTGSRRPGCCF